NTGTKNRGVQKVDNSSAINWCEIPVSVVEMGFLSNPDEDRWLQTEDYQKKIVDGISDAIDRYFAVGSEG
ncbi:MAG: N-acetylmuramoyl-L-alanine amidase, partial [Lachnospiraceae bacterium]|nr:N-acetylmuramoyl-L-alanine amidase [Lachnospiraceae bacterium]